MPVVGGERRSGGGVLSLSLSSSLSWGLRLNYGSGSRLKKFRIRIHVRFRSPIGSVVLGSFGRRAESLKMRMLDERWIGVYRDVSLRCCYENGKGGRK